MNMKKGLRGKKRATIRLDAEERAIEKALAANIDQLKDVGGLERYVKMAKEQVKRNANVLSLKIRQADLKRLRELAEKKSLSPEALAAQILHQYFTGRFNGRLRRVPRKKIIPPRKQSRK